MPLKQLIDNLNRQIEKHREMLNVLVEEVALPASCTIQQLEELHTRRDRLLGDIKRLEAKRLPLIKTIIQQAGVKKDSTLKEIIAHCDQKTALTLTTQREELMGLVTRIREVGKKNAERAVLRKNCIADVQQALFKSFKRTSVYSMRGVIQQPKGSYTLRKRI